MKTKLALLTLALLILSPLATAQQPQRPRRRQSATPKAQARQRTRPQGQALANLLRRQLETRKAEHGQLLAELETIRKLADEENAAKTVERISQLIERLTAKWKQQQAALEQRLARASQGRQAPAADRGKKAPDFTLSSFDGKTVRLADLHGKVVVLEWFNFECPFSKYHYATKSTMTDLAKKYADKGVVWLAINSTNHTKPEPNIAFAKQHNIPYPILDDRDGKVGHAYGAKTTPHMIVIDRRGNIVYDGAIDNAPLGKVTGGGKYVNYVDQVLAALTAGKRMEPKTTKPYGCSVKYAK